MGLALWCANEKWEYGTDANGKKWARVTGRERCPTKHLLDLRWWYRNDYEQQL
jgi:hypothetical protein